MRKYLLTLVFLALFSLIALSQYSNDIVIEKLLKTDTTSIGQKIAYPKYNDPEITLAKITIPPGKSNGWHKHDIPVFTYILKGTLTVELENHEVFKYTENTSFAESMNTFHNGTNQEKSDLVVIAVYLGGRGHKLSIPKEK